MGVVNDKSVPPDKGALEVSSSLGSTAAHDFKVNVQPTVVLKDENDVENEGEKQKPGTINVLFHIVLLASIRMQI